MIFNIVHCVRPFPVFFHNPPIIYRKLQYTKATQGVPAKAEGFQPVIGVINILSMAKKVDRPLINILFKPAFKFTLALDLLWFISKVLAILQVSVELPTLANNFVGAKPFEVLTKASLHPKG